MYDGIEEKVMFSVQYGTAVSMPFSGFLLIYIVELGFNANHYMFK